MTETISLVVYYLNNKPYISAAELFDIIYPYSKSRYANWIKINVTEQPQELPLKGIDFIPFVDTKVKKPLRIKGGKKRNDYLLSPIFAIQLCYQTKTLPARDVKNFLYKFTN